jgi:hypothetical protein
MLAVFENLNLFVSELYDIYVVNGGDVWVFEEIHDPKFVVLKYDTFETDINVKYVPLMMMCG